MTKFFNLRTFLAASAVSAAAAASMFAQTGSASAGVLDCRGNSPNAVLECCQQEVRQNGRPKWMRSPRQLQHRRHRLQGRRRNVAAGHPRGGEREPLQVRQDLAEGSEEAEGPRSQGPEESEGQSARHDAR